MSTAPDHELFAYRKRLFAARRLRHDEPSEVDANLPRVCRVERMLRVDERRRAARFLDIRHSVERKRSLSRRLVPVELDYAPLREPANAKGQIKPESPGRDGLDIPLRGVAELQYRHLPELLPDFLHHVFKCHGFLLSS